MFFFVSFCCFLLMSSLNSIFTQLYSNINTAHDIASKELAKNVALSNDSVKWSVYNCMNCIGGMFAVYFKRMTASKKNIPQTWNDYIHTYRLPHSKSIETERECLYWWLYVRIRIVRDGLESSQFMYLYEYYVFAPYSVSYQILLEFVMYSTRFSSL